MVEHNQEKDAQAGNTGLVDIRDVAVDPELPKDERVAAFVRQINDPYHFACGGFTVTARFAEGGPTLEDCMKRLLA